VHPRRFLHCILFQANLRIGSFLLKFSFLIIHLLLCKPHRFCNSPVQTPARKFFPMDKAHFFSLGTAELLPLFSAVASFLNACLNFLFVRLSRAGFFPNSCSPNHFCFPLSFVPRTLLEWIPRTCRNFACEPNSLAAKGSPPLLVAGGGAFCASRWITVPSRA